MFKQVAASQSKNLNLCLCVCASEISCVEARVNNTLAAQYKIDSEITMTRQSLS